MMTRSRRFGLFTLASVSAGALLLGGCSGPDSSRVTVFNQSTVDVEAQTWLSDLEASSGVSSHVAGGGEADLVLIHEGVADPRVTVSIGATGSDRLPYMIDLAPPGPYFIRVRGNDKEITVVRTGNPETFDGKNLPRDPRMDNMHNDIPPVNPSYNRP